MNFSNSDFDTLKNNGFILKKNVLNLNQVEKIKKIIKLNPEGKNPEIFYSTNLKSFLIKAIKLNFRKIINSLYFLEIKNLLNLDSLANNFFKDTSKLLILDGYYNTKQNVEILPWHCDKSYNGATQVKENTSPDLFHLKFMFYLTNVSPGNGCTSYIPGSQKITHAVKTCLFEKTIEYLPFFKLEDLIKLIHTKDNYAQIINKLGSEKPLTKFLDNAKKIDGDKKNDIFDFNASPGDLLIFNEMGVHRGSKPSLHERVILRYIYTKTSNYNSKYDQSA
ncbi:phytanoyl-CoA dioxygenase family protein [Pelagibacteraceae bacterium]|nr:phytanoyl-CoA dioxygenase family protein [Pelagibacteraceae bacterium]